MWLALGTGGVVLVVLLWELARPTAMRALARVGEAWKARGRIHEEGYDPGRERRAEQRARELLRSCVSEEEWEMYRDLGVLRVFGPARGETVAPVSDAGASGEASQADEPGASAPALAPYAYLIYPHKPIVAYVPATGELLSEYCVAFPDETRPYGSPRLPDSDDVLAKWMALTGDERRLIGEANMHLPGRQVDPERVSKDLARLARWESERGAGRTPDGVERPARRRLDNVRAA
ncbi:MAG TPA: hypothetical protein VH061_08785 [Solirubrobacteraceae bacterium]|jgi:hypothetical protein|nr:hypothetical protein [Solirubrobacteraceae bacterium]